MIENKNGTKEIKQANMICSDTTIDLEPNKEQE